MNFEYRKNIDDKLNLKNLKKCEELMIQNKMNFISKGHQGEVFKVMSNDCGSVVVKKKIIKKEDNKWKNNEKWLTDELEIEYKIMSLTNRMIEKFICPNFVHVYDFIKSVPLIVMEYADGDCKFLFKDIYFPTELYKSFIFQILVAIYSFTNYTMLFHRDVKLGNILYKKINKNIIFHYKIENTDYYVPTYGYLFMLCDYGTAKFKLDDRMPDIINLNYKIIKNYIVDFSIKFQKEINTSTNVNNIIQTIRNSEVIPSNNNFNKNMFEIIDSIKKIKTKKMNDYVFEINDILTHSTNILKILSTFFNEFIIDVDKNAKIIDFNVVF